MKRLGVVVGPGIEPFSESIGLYYFPNLTDLVDLRFMELETKFLHGFDEVYVSAHPPCFDALRHLSLTISRDQRVVLGGVVASLAPSGVLRVLFPNAEIVKGPLERWIGSRVGAVPANRDWSGKLKGTYPKLRLNVAASRGCDRRCNYCHVRVLDVPRWTPVPILGVKRELELVRNLDCRVFFTDWDFFGPTSESVDRGISLLTFAKSDLRFQKIFLSAHPEVVKRDPHVLRHLDERVHVYMSVESGSESQRRRLGRTITSVDEDIDSIVSVAQCGCRVESGFILVDPLSTRDEVLRSLEVAEKLLEFGVAVWVQGCLRIPFWQARRFEGLGIKCELDRSLDNTTFTFVPRDEKLSEVVNYLRRVSLDFQSSKHAFREGRNVKGWLRDIIRKIREILE